MKKSFLLYSILFILSLTGCSQKMITTYKTTPENSIKTIKIAKSYYIQDKINEEELGIFQAYTLPFYIGGNPLLSKREYFLRKINKKPLLFKNFGIKNYLYQLIYVSDFNVAEKKAKQLKYRNIEDMYISMFNKFINLSDHEFLSYLQKLDTQNKININDIMNNKNIETKIDNIIYTIYGQYLSYEKEDYPVILKEWAIYKDEEPISFTRKSYRPYALILLVIDSLLSH